MGKSKKSSAIIKVEVGAQIVQLNNDQIKSKIIESSRKLEAYDSELKKYKNTVWVFKFIKKRALNDSMRDAIGAIGDLSKVTLFVQGQTIKNQEVLKLQNEVLFETQQRIEEQTKKNEKNTLDLKNLLEEFLKLKDLTLKDIQGITSTINNYQEINNKAIDQKFHEIDKTLQLSLEDVNDTIQEYKINWDLKKQMISSLKVQIKLIFRVMIFLFLSNIALVAYLFMTHRIG